MKFRLSDPYDFQRCCDYFTMGNAVISAIAPVNGWNSEGQELHEALAAYLINKNVQVAYADFTPYQDEIGACFCEIEGVGCVIYVNQRVRALNEDLWCSYENYYFLHELCHMASVNHLRMRVHAPGKIENMDIIFDELCAYQQYLSADREQEMAAEMFALRMAFHPIDKFIRVVKDRRANMEEIALESRMPLDCVIKFSILMFHRQIKFHYCKWDCSNNYATDWYTSQGHLPEDFVRDLPSKDGTVAKQALTNKATIPLSISPHSNSVCCSAYYRDRSRVMLGRNESVIVLGANAEDLKLFLA